MWNYPKGKELDNHFHKKFERSSFRTNEFVYVVRGKLNVTCIPKMGYLSLPLLLKKEREFFNIILRTNIQF